jgi:hypothetical protein
MTLDLNDHFCSCSVAALNYVSAQSPESTIRQYCKKLKHPTFNEHCKKYVDGYKFGYYIHVFFSGPNHKDWTVNRDHHYSNVGSCDQLAAYIREHKLGPVVETEPRWNHRHSSRPKGQGDVIAYIWSPDPDALAKWFEEHKEVKK